MSALPPTNQVILTGELTEEPSVHYLAPDFPEVRLRLKTEEEVTGREGGRPYRQRLFHRVIARGQVGMAVEHLHEGSHLSIAGRIEYVREAAHPSADDRSLSYRSQSISFSYLRCSSL